MKTPLIIVATLLMLFVAGEAQAGPNSPTNCAGDGKLNVVGKGNATDLYYGQPVFRCVDKFKCVQTFVLAQIQRPTCEEKSRKEGNNGFQNDKELEKLQKCYRERGCDIEAGCLPKVVILTYSCPAILE